MAGDDAAEHGNRAAEGEKRADAHDLASPFDDFPDLGELLDAAAVRLVEGVSRGDFVAWFVAEVHVVAPRVGAALDEASGEDRRAAFARGLWDRLPRPDNRFRPDPVPVPQRNDPCPCGSGRKYKRCCVDVGSVIELPSHLLLVHVLNAYSAPALETLDGWTMEPDGLLDALAVWIEEGRGDRAVRLAAPMFSPERPPRGRLPRHAADVLEILLDGWPVGFREPAFEALTERLGTHRDAELASVTVQALVRRLHRRGEADGAWARLRLGARRFPDDPELAELEIELLNDEGRFEESAALAHRWSERLVALDPQNAEYAESLLERAADIDPEIALERVRAVDGVLDRLVTLLEETPPGPIAGTHARIAAGELVLAPTPALSEVEHRWRARFGQFTTEDTVGASTEDTASERVAAKGRAPHGPTADALTTDALTDAVDFLDDEPLALSSFFILEALVVLSNAWADEPWAEAVFLRLLMRAEFLLYRHVSREAGFETSDGLPDWGAMIWETAPRVSGRHPANRPALDLLAGLARWHDAAYENGEPGDRLSVLLDALRGLDPERSGA